MSHLPHPLVIAHRGARAFAPENTLDAFQKAVDLGAHGIELDVQLTADQQLIVLHDETLERCSNAHQRFPHRDDYRVASFHADEIQQLDAGSWFVHQLQRPPADRLPFLQSITDLERNQFISDADLQHFASGNVRHPTLRQVLESLRNWNIRCNIELKAHDHVTPELCDRTVQLVRELDVDHRVLISSFDHNALRHVRQRDPHLALGVLVTTAPADPVALCRALGAQAYHPGCYGRYDSVGFSSDTFRRTGRLPAELFQSCRAAQIDVFAWTENDPARIAALADAGATGVITDYPNRMMNGEAPMTKE